MPTPPAAVMKAVNSSLYGLAGRVQSVQQAITYLGTREVAGAGGAAVELLFQLAVLDLQRAPTPHTQHIYIHRTLG